MWADLELHAPGLIEHEAFVHEALEDLLAYARSVLSRDDLAIGSEALDKGPCGSLQLVARDRFVANQGNDAVEDLAVFRRPGVGGSGAGGGGIRTASSLCWFCGIGGVSGERTAT